MNNIDNENTLLSIKPKDYIDLNLLFLSIRRNYKLVFKIFIFSVFFGSIIAISKKKVWQGEFEIVLDSENTPITRNISDISPRILSLAGINKDNKLETEVGILNSPSVLMDVFEFVKNRKLKSKDFKDLRFKKWKQSSLKIRLKEKTSILGIKYKDTDKELILPVLEKISNQYQKYSGDKRMRKLDLAINYYQSQIKIYKDKSKDSFVNAQKFEIDNNLSFNNPLNDQSKIFSNKGMDPSLSNFDLSFEIAELRNLIKAIDIKIQFMNEYEDDSDQVLYMASTIPMIRQDDLFERLNEVNLNLSRLRVAYKENDIGIQDLLKEKDSLIALLKSQVKGYLNAEKNNLTAKLKSVERPTDILIKHKELLSNASKDRLILDNLENEFRMILLEKARLEDPWKLITKPTIYPNHVGPGIKRIIGLSGFIGLILGVLIGLILDKKKGTLFSLEDLEFINELNKLTTLSINEKDTWEENLALILQTNYLDFSESTSFLYIGDLGEDLISNLKKIVNEYKKNKFIFSKNILEAIKSENIILIFQLGITKKIDIFEVQKKLSLQKSTILGCIVIK